MAQMIMHAECEGVLVLAQFPEKSKQSEDFLDSYTLY